MLSSTKDKGNRAWIILAACCLIYGSISGMLINCRGIYFSAAADTLGITRGEYGSYLIYYGISATLSFPLTAKLLKSGNIKLTLSLFISFFCIMTFMLGRIKNMEQCYIIACVQGLVGGVLALYFMPYIIRNWFSKRQGTALGIATMFSGVVAVFMNPVTARLINSIGWRDTYSVIAVMIWLLSVPTVLLFIERCPEDCGEKPYGYAESLLSNPARVAPPPPAEKETGVIMLFIIGAIWGSTAGYAQQISSYSASLNLSTAVGALAVSFCMIGAVGGKLLFGILNDKLGVLKTATIEVLLVSASFLILICGGKVFTALYVGAFINGFSLSLLGVQLPLLAARIFKTREKYLNIYTYICAMNCFITAGSSGVIGKLYDVFGSYYQAFYMSIALLIISLFLLVTQRKAL